ncbi:MAG TPA: hydroxylamine reductase [Thermoleophilia bacterium]|nr:hydroxylamine reductase [Thermoleophilia bacterium]
MFCNQCEQTRKGSGCTTAGVCGKPPEVAALQDLLTYALRGLSQVAIAARDAGVSDAKVDSFTSRALFSTLTNVNFDASRFQTLILEAVFRRDQLEEQLVAAGGAVPTHDPAIAFHPAPDMVGLVRQGAKVRLPIDWEADEDIRSLQEITLYGLRGLAAYADHAAILGQEDPDVYAFVQSTLTKLADRSLGLNDWVGLALETGKVNLRAMELLDAGNTGTYGHPVPTSVPLGHKQGKAILVSGHDLRDLHMILEQSAGKGINVYTHGEMLPTHGYPGLKKYPHFFGHYGTAWQNQKGEFGEFPGAILMTTNCLQDPKEYMDNIFTTGLVGWSGVRHLENGDFGPVIEKALEMPGFAKDQTRDSVTVGFARNAVMGVAGKVIEAVKSGDIKHFLLVGGCDGAKPGRNYYTELVERAPADTVILTLACGKFRFFDRKLGDIGGIPRLLDIGQCNDAYSAVQIALALADAFEVGVNDLPLSIVLSWYEQKAVSILLTLLHLGIKGIRIGPSLPAFISENVLNVLVENFDLKPVGDPDEDLAAMLA